MKTSWNCILFDQKIFSYHTFTFDHVIKGFETCDVEGPTSIIQKVTTTMFSGKALNGSDCSEMWFVGG